MKQGTGLRGTKPSNSGESDERPAGGSEFDGYPLVTPPKSNRLLRVIGNCVLVALLVAPLPSVAAMRVIGVLSSLPALGENIFAFEPLRAYGWVEGRDFVLERRFAGGDPERLRAYTKDLVARQPDLIVCIGTEATIAARDAASTIPIVMIYVGDPVGLGLVDSLARPGKNITGYSSVFVELHAKRAALVKELLPPIRRIGVLWHRANPLFEVQRNQHEAAYRSLGIEPLYGEVQVREDFVPVIARLATQRAEALVILADPLLNINARQIVAAATSHGLPVIGSGDEIVNAGGVMSYEPTRTGDSERLMATVNKVLRGTRPADIPVEQPTKFELVLNAKSARAIGIEIPQAMLLRADRIVR